MCLCDLFLSLVEHIPEIMLRRSVKILTQDLKSNLKLFERDKAWSRLVFFLCKVTFKHLLSRAKLVYSQSVEA